MQSRSEYSRNSDKLQRKEIRWKVKTGAEKFRVMSTADEDDVSGNGWCRNRFLCAGEERCQASRTFIHWKLYSCLHSSIATNWILISERHKSQSHVFQQTTFYESSSTRYSPSASVRQQKQRDNNGGEIDWNAQRDEVSYFSYRNQYSISCLRS